MGADEEIVMGGCSVVGLGKGLCCHGMLLSRGAVVRFCSSSEVEVLEMSFPGVQRERRTLLSPD